MVMTRAFKNVGRQILFEVYTKISWVSGVGVQSQEVGARIQITFFDTIIA